MLSTCTFPPIPNKVTHPLAYKAVTSSMVHGPCGHLNPSAPCTAGSKDGRCSKGYPKPLRETTSCTEDGYPQYKRPERKDGEPVVHINGIPVDNSWIVPHNLYLSAKYGAHINVELCSTVIAVKYIFKYVFKGHDRATVEITESSSTGNQPGQPTEATSGEPQVHDEIKEYVTSRYVSASESFWRIYGYKLHDEYPDVIRLPIHLPGQHLVYFEEGEDLADAAARAEQRTMLTEFFEFNQRLLDDDAFKQLTAEEQEARKSTYANFPIGHVYSHKRWKVRQAGRSVGRIYFLSPSAGDVYYLRMPLNVVKAPRSFEELRTVNGQVYSTFKEACIAKGLLDDDDEWDKCLEEAATMHTGSQLRHLFVMLLLFCHPSNPGALWIKYAAQLSDDLGHKRDPINSALIDIERILSQHDRTLKRIPGMPFPMPDEDDNMADENRLIKEQENLCLTFNQDEFEANKTRLNDDQRAAFEIEAAYETLLRSENSIGNVENIDKDSDENNNKNGKPKPQHTFFIDGPAGTGKTFLYSLLLERVRSSGHIALAVASSGIAALLMKGGRTAHSRFSIPIHINERSSCDMPPSSNQGELIQRAKLIVWDEAPMTHRHVFEAFERTLRDIMKTVDPALEERPFGGKIVVFGGDFRQIPPVIPKGFREDIVMACFKQSPLWRGITVLRLTENMRLANPGRRTVQEQQEQREYADWLLQVGEGRVGGQEFDDGSMKISIPSDILLPPSATVEDLINDVYPDLRSNVGNGEYMVKRAILCPKNEDVRDVNDKVLATFPGASVEYLSADSIVDGDDEAQRLYPDEFLHSFNASGLPPHRLVLKKWMPVILLRNLRPQDGLCNGTRLICKEFHSRVIEAKIITGTNAGMTVLIPRISLTTGETDLPFTLRRKQFPICPAFAMSINKSQGQTLDHVGIYLPTPVFTHGQLYVALSRATSRRSIRILRSDPVDDMETNVVYRETLQ